MENRSTKAQLRRHLKTLPSFKERLDARRRHGQSVDVIARYVHTVIEQSQNPRDRSIFFDEKESLEGILNDDEMAAYLRVRAGYWASQQRKKLKNAAAERIKKDNICKAHHRDAERNTLRKEECGLRKGLLAKGAITIGEVARRLKVSVSQVRMLHADGRLPSAGFVPIQHSRGKPVYLWLPETIIRFLNLNKSESQIASSGRPE